MTRARPVVDHAVSSPCICTTTDLRSRPTRRRRQLQQRSSERQDVDELGVARITTRYDSSMRCAATRPRVPPLAYIYLYLIYLLL